MTVRRRHYVALFALALALRLIYLHDWHDTPLFSVLLGDARQYDEWARSIAAGDWVGHEVFYQAPLYPYFLGLIYWAVGPSLWAVRLVQVVIGSSASVALALAGRRFFSPQAGLLSGLLLALYAPAIHADGLLQKGVLDGLFMTLVLWIAGEIGVRATHSRVALLGLVLGAFALTRENVVVLPPLFALWLWLRARDGAWRPRLARIAFLAAGVGLVLVPVGLRNAALGGGFLPTTSQLGPNFYIGNQAHATGRYLPLRAGRGSARYERQDATEIAEAASGQALAPAEVSRFWLRRALDEMRAAPGRWLGLLLRKALLVWHAGEILDTDSLELYRDHSRLLDLLGRVSHFGVLLPLAVLGAFLTRTRWRELALLYALAAALAAAVALFYVMARYRYPLVPILALFAAPALLELVAWVRRRAWGALAPALLLVASVALPCNWPLPGDVDPRTITYLDLGNALVDARRFEEAEESFARAIALDPQFADAHYGLGRARAAAGDPRGALAPLGQALRLSPDHALAQVAAGMAWLALGDAAAAERSFRAAIAIDPALAEARNDLAVVLAGQGRSDEALAELAAAARASPRDADVRTNLAKLLLARGDRTAARAELVRALAVRPDHAEARRLLGLLDARPAP